MHSAVLSKTNFQRGTLIELLKMLIMQKIEKANDQYPHYNAIRNQQ